MRKKGKSIGRIGVLCLLCALLFSSCGRRTDPTANGTGTDDTGRNSQTEAPTSALITDGSEPSKDDGKQEELPKVDIEKSNAAKKYFVGTTNKNAVSYKTGEEMKFTVSLRADGNLASCAKFK